MRLGGARRCGWPNRRPAWYEQCVAVAVLALAAVALNALATGDHLLKTVLQGYWPVAGLNLALPFVGACAAGVAMKLRGHQRGPLLETHHA
jgi:hypothetical protein